VTLLALLKPQKGSAMNGPAGESRLYEGPPSGLARPPLAAGSGRRGRLPTAPSGLEGVLLGLSWASPTSHDLAANAIARLAETQSVLPSAGSAPLSRLLDGLRARIGFVLDHWAVELATLDPMQWSAAHAQALDRDLREIASSGAVILNFTASRAARSIPAGVPAGEPAGDLGGGRYVPAGSACEGGSGRHAAAGSAAPAAHGVVAVLARLPEGGARLLMQAAGIVAAAVVVSAVCFEAFDRQPRPEPGPAILTTAAHGGSTPSSTPRPPTASQTPSGSHQPVAAGTATSLQMSLLGASEARPRIDVIVYLTAASTAPITLVIDYRAQDDTKAGTVRRTVSGAVWYQIAVPIDATNLCGKAVVVSAQAGGLSAGDSTAAAQCAKSPAPSSSKGSDT
jgi:hypothetical protein